MLDSPMPHGQMLRLTVATSAIQVPGAPNALAGRLIEELGYSAIYVSRPTIAAGMLVSRDECVLTLTELVQQVRYLTARVTVPVIVDAGDCTGDAASMRRAIVELEQAGVAGIELGDRCNAGQETVLLSPTQMQSKLRAARDARADDQLVLIARTNARTTDGLDAAVARARLYMEAGAEWVIPESLTSLDEFTLFAKSVFDPPRSPEVRLVARMSEFGPSPLLTFDELAAIGYSVVLYPETLFRVAMKAMESTLAILAVDGTQRDILDLMQSVEELEDLAGNVYHGV
jgi:methylisocitrate lyase